jgi:GT2 family glycosyltransferase
MNSHPSVVIIIIIYNSVEDTINCLNTLLQTDYPNFSIYVLDNGSQKNHIPELQQKFTDHRITWDRSEINLGFTGGNNLVISKTDSQYVALLNNDTEVEREWLKELILVAESDEKIAVCQAKLRSLNFKNYFEYAGAAGGKIDKLGYPYARGRIGFHLEEDRGQYDQITQIQWASGAASLIKTDKLKKVGNLCEDFFLYHEETDLCWRIQNFGYKIMFVPKSIVYHKGLGSTKGINAKSSLVKKTFYIHRNNLYMIVRNMSFAKLLYVLPLRIVLDYISMIFYAMTGKFEYIAAVAKAQLSFIKMIPTAVRFRKTQKEINYEAEKSFKPFSIFWSYFVLGKKHYSEVETGEKSEIPLKYYDDVIQKNFVITNRKKGFQLATSPYIFIPILAAIVVISWFSAGKLIASGEEGLAFADPYRTFTLYKYLWYDTGTGYPMPLTIPRTTFYAIVSFFDFFFPVWIAQALVLYLTIIIGMTGTYVLSMVLIKNKIISTLSALFYFFNLYSMTQVFGRQLTSGYVAWAYLPIFIICWIKIIETKKVIWIVFLAASSFIFSNGFGHPAYVITLWIPIVLYWGYYFASNVKKKTEIISATKIILFACLIWIVTNLWWIYPFAKLGQSAFTTPESAQGSFDSLRGVSKSFPISEIIQLKHTAIFDNIFNRWYQQPPALSITYSIAVISVIGMVIAIKKKNLSYIALLAIVAVFLSKGSNSPLGYKFYYFLFHYIPSTQALRNPYEKLGILVTLAYAMLFAIGLYAVLERIKKPEIRILSGIIGIGIVMGLLVYPIWNGTLYGAEVQNTRVKVPSYYEQANKYISEQKNDGRILLLPIFYGDGVAYNWKGGEYSGIDPSEFLFDRAAVSKILRMKYYDDKYKELYDNFTSASSSAVLQNLSEMNIRYLVVRNDYKIRNFEPGTPQKTAAYINTVPEINKIKTFGQLDIYEYKNQKPYGHLIALGGQAPELHYTKINPTKYKINIKNATKGYTLLFKETYNQSWKASINNEVQNEHTIQYNYANGWKINKAGTYTIDLDFKL